MSTGRQFLPECNRDQYADVWKKRHSFLSAIEEVCRRHGISSQSAKVFETGSNLVVQVTPELIVKLYFPFLRDQFESERSVLKAIKGRLTVATPELFFEGELEGWPYIIMGFVTGTSLGEIWSSIEQSNKLSIMKELGQIIRALHEVPTDSLKESFPNDWNNFLTRQLEGCISRHQKTGLPENLLSELPSLLPASAAAIWDGKKPVLISGDFTPEHILLSKQSGKWSVVGLIDFADCMIGQHEYDFTGPATFITCGDTELLTQMFISYGYTRDSLNADLRRRMMLLTILHRFANFKEQVRVEGWQQKFTTLLQVEQFLWGFDK
ncbi:MAG: aminoglycoside 3'-phosphotransferase/choline kinase family protein [Bdellovibrionota bacterium]